MRPDIRRTVVRAAALGLFAAAAFAPQGAEARNQRGDDVRVISPSEVSSGNTLTTIFSTERDKTVFVLKKGKYDLLGAPAAVLRRSDGILICGATGNAKDVVLESSFQSYAFLVDHSRDVEIRDITIRNASPVLTALRLGEDRVETTSATTDSFAHDVTLRGCTLEGGICVQASVGIGALTMKGCTLRVTGNRGIGLLWQDGGDLFVTRNRFRTAKDGTSSNDVVAGAGVRVLGPISQASNGERARTIVMSRNDVNGDFEFGIELNDVTDVRVRRNTVKFPNPVQDIGVFAAPGQNPLRARIGIALRRATASGLPDELEVRRNRVRKALFGLWMRDTGVPPDDTRLRSAVSRNDFRRCGTSDPNLDTENSRGRPGGAVLVSLITSGCPMFIERNDFRGLRSPVTEPAVVEDNGLSLADCFQDPHRNKTDRGRPLYTGASKR
jgi:hypothetical protein